MTVTYRFGRFELSPAARQLVADGQPLALGGRAFDLLVALVERRDRLVSKNELLDLVWPGLVVEENNLQVHVSALRKILGAQAIATVAGRGYRFTWAVTDATAAAARPSASKRHLPVPLASFIGRERELAELRTMLTRHRLVTLTGVGGIGKTRLALELASGLADAYADGVWFVDLAPVFQPEHVTSAVASALGVRDDAGQPLLARLQAFVAERTLLVVLDNCEHLLHACGQRVGDFLNAAADLRIVATSREPLHVSGEAVYPLPSLPVPDPRDDDSLAALGRNAAVRLFTDRAIDARPDFTLTQRDAAAVARICRDLDGIPLALELAAARTRTMSSEALAARLVDRFAVLKGDDPTAMPRQQTLRATIDWSFDLLAPVERALLCRLAVFAGGFTMDAAEAMGATEGGTPGAAFDILGHLVDKSLIVFDVHAERYRLLETVRQYALERLAAAGEEAAARDRHLACYAALAGQAGPGLASAEHARWRARLDAEHENILGAFARARQVPDGGPVGLAMVYDLNRWFWWNHLELWCRVADEALAHPGAQGATAARSRALYAAAFVNYLTGRHAEAFALAESSVAIARACRNAQALSEALYNLGIAALAIDRLDEARTDLEESLALARQAGDATVISMALTGLGEVHTQQGQHEHAEAAYLEALANSSDPESTVVTLGNLARTAILQRASDKATRYLREAIAKAGPECSPIAGWIVLLNGAGIAALRGQWARALRMGGAGDAHGDRHGLHAQGVDRRIHALQMAPAREALGVAAAASAVAAGRALASADALAEVRAWLEGEARARRSNGTHPTTP
ncbi:MAG: winged helix-turn-helix domain-containing protein [Burkholderiales bacterium]|nr:winged helix-turn-helix domain-containing protein [Burkholderiales bacterium]